MLLDEISEHLAAFDFGIPVAIYAGGFPAAGADDAAAVFEFAGGPPVRVKDQARALSESARFQVLCRSKKYTVAREIAEQVMFALDGLRGEIGSPPVFYSGIRAMQSPFFLDRDDAGRTRIATNYRAEKEFSPLS